MVIPLKYESARPFSEGLAPVELDGKWGLINKKGDIIVPYKYDNVSSFYPFSKGLAEIKLNGKVGLINKQGEVVVQPKYDSIYGPKRTGVTTVELNGKQFYVNIKNGTEYYEP